MEKLKYSSTPHQSSDFNPTKKYPAHIQICDRLKTLPSPKWAIDLFRLDLTFRK